MFTLNPAYTFLNNCRIEEGQEITHQVYGKFNGSFNLDTIQRKEFMELYTDCIKQNIEMNVLEKPKEYGPILIDIDLNQPKDTGCNSSVKERLYNRNQIVSLISIYNSIIKSISGESHHIFVFEKPEPTIKESIIKDGFHMVIPNVCFHKDIRHHIRTQAIKSCAESKLFDGYSNSLDDIIDKAVVSSNGWFLYGSSKPGCKPYKLTMEFDGSTNKINENPIHTPSEIIKYFSIQCSNYKKKHQTEIVNGLDVEIEKEIIHETIEKNDSNSLDDSDSSVKYTIGFHTDLLNLLDEDWKINHEKWMKVGFACYQEENVDGDYFDLWHKWSQCAKYKITESELRKIWKTIKDKQFKPFTFKSITHLIKIEKPQESLELYKKHFPKKSVENSYEQIKQNFELAHFKILNPIVYVQVQDDKMIIKKKSEFKDTYENLFYYEEEFDEGKKSKIVKKDFISKWMKDPEIKTYDKWDFMPMCVDMPNVYNTFRGWEASFIPKDEQKSINIFDTLVYKHIQNICGNLDDVTRYFNLFISRKLRNPSNLTNTAMVIKSIEGCGKDTLLDWIGHKIIGSKMYANESNIDLFFGHFNSQIENKVLVVMNEVEGIKAFESNGSIKDGITRKINTIEKKNMTPYDNTNNIGWIFLTNSDNPVKIEPTNRRFMAFESNNSIANNKEYFDNLRAEMNDPKVIRAFYDYWMKLIESDNFDFTNARPKTNYYNNITQLNISPMTHWLIEEINDNFNGENIKRFTTNELFNKYNDYITSGKFNAQITITKFVIELKKYNGIEQSRTSKNNGFTIDYKLLKSYLIKSKGVMPQDVEFIDV